MQKLASENAKIRITGAEIESKPGGKTHIVQMKDLETEKKEGQ
jgi:hypothetical protein